VNTASLTALVNVLKKSTDPLTQKELGTIIMAASCPHSSCSTFTAEYRSNDFSK